MTTPTPDWFEQGRRLLAGWLDGASAAVPHGHDDDAAEARSCPLCAARALWRDRRPDLLEGLADVLASTAEVLRASAARPAPPETPSDHPAPPEETVSPQAPAPSPVQRIDVA